MPQVRRVSWRTLLRVCAGVLLPLPLVLLLGSLLYPEVRSETLAGRPISPHLDNEQRSRRMTYGRTCILSSDCEPPLGCLFEARTGYAHCMDSQCTTDAQCPEGQSCQTLATEGAGPWVRFCVPLGVRQEGEKCVAAASNQENACAPGLLCGGREGWCSRPCNVGTADCPEGFFCADTLPGPVCLPTCEARECPSDQTCIQFDEGASVCAHVYGPNCQQSPCPEGSQCRVHPEPPHPGKVWMACVARCGGHAPPCGAGLICDGWHCVQPCDPQGPEVCGEGYSCGRRTESRPFSCQPDDWREWAL
ncbi:uncharacterized protein STAUR_0015 [Stigmatella aurantiaca DW4/3-1]|uniref:Uncharacterized protein n=1 Tax=Stigmatella aurantiaca (strain DW4/3-1) TaxID=378806 RepID=E3FHE7_STIAD|nr:uncharacterized protein STAUR_0015 [Stigmatella aurantiaca DW4/3-1]